MTTRHLLTCTLGLLLSANADDIAPLSDEFNNAATFANWSDLSLTEGWEAPSYEVADINTTEAGRFHIVPAGNTWFGHLRGLLFFKEITGDFVATTRLRVLSRHNPADPTETPNRSFSLTGILVHGPRSITRAAPSPYTTGAVWPPQDFGSDYVPNTENYIFLSYGTAGNAGTRQFEIKTTRNSSSRLYFDDTGISQSENEVWLQMVRVGDTVVCLRKHSENGNWIVENRYPNPDHPFPDFGATLQVGLTAYTDWPTASPFNSAGLEASYHFNYAPPISNTRDLISQVDYFRFARPDTALTETVLQGMAVSYNPSSNTTADPPVLLSASPVAATHLGDIPDSSFNPTTDSDDDGYPDGLEFALGTNGNDASSLPEITIGQVDENSQFSFPANGTGLLQIQESGTLDNWNIVARRTSSGWTAPPAGWSINTTNGVTTVVIPSEENTQFVRLAAIF